MQPFDDYLAQYPLPWLLSAIFVSLFEIRRWRSVPNALVNGRREPIFNQIAEVGFFFVVSACFVIIFWFGSFVETISTFAFAWGVSFLVSGIVVPLVFRGDSWIQLTLASIAFWPIAVALCVYLYRSYLQFN